MSAGLADDLRREPPHDLHAEQCALGGMMLKAAEVGEVMNLIAARDYYRPAHGLIHETVIRLFEAGEPSDWVSVVNELTKRGEITRVGGAPYVHTLIESVPVAENAGYYAGIVRERSVLRRLIEAGTRIVQLGHSGDGEVGDIAAQACRAVEDAATVVDHGDIRSMRELVYAVLDDVEKGTERGLPLPWADLTSILNGLAPGQLVYVAARPAMGKSLVGAGIAAHVSVKLGLPALLMSMEMRAEDITLRLVSNLARVSLWGLTHHEASEDDWARISRVTEGIASAPLVIDDSSLCSLARIRSRLREMARTNPARVLIVDYLGLMETSARSENRQNAVADLSRGLKLIAGEFGIPVVVLAQLNRGPEQRSDHRPLLSDLRDSGAQEQDADVVILLHREDAYEPESPRAGEMDFIVAKNRQGPTGTITVAFQGHYARVMDMARITDIGAEDSWSPSAVAEAS